MELVSAAREYESRSPEPSLAGFVDQLSLLSDADEEAGSRDSHVLMMTMHSAKGLEFPMVIIAGLEEGLFPALAVGRRRRRARRGATALLRRPDAGPAPVVLTSAARRRVFGDYQSTEPSRFIDEIPPELVEDGAVGDAFAMRHRRMRRRPAQRRARLAAVAHGGGGPRYALRGRGPVVAGRPQDWAAREPPARSASAPSRRSNRSTTTSSWSSGSSRSARRRCAPSTRSSSPPSVGHYGASPGRRGGAAASGERPSGMSHRTPAAVARRSSREACQPDRGRRSRRPSWRPTRASRQRRECPEDGVTDPCHGERPAADPQH